MTSDSARIQRIRRALAKEGQSLKLSLGDLGIAVIDNHTNTVVASHCTLDQLGRELNV